VAIGEVTRTPTGTVQTTALSSFSRLSDAQELTRGARVETERRGTETARIVCAVGDGAEWLQHFVDHHRPDAVRILDFPHAAQRVCAAAQAVWGAGTAATSAWLDDQLHRLKDGDPATVLAAIRALPVARAPSPAEAAMARDTVLAYLTTRWEQIQYARFRAQGYPIGSGIVESANKLVVEGRLKGSGMHSRTRAGHADGRGAGDGVRRPLGGSVAGDLASIVRDTTGAADATSGDTGARRQACRTHCQPSGMHRSGSALDRAAPVAGVTRTACRGWPSDCKPSLAQTTASSSSHDGHARKSVRHTPGVGFPLHLL
jgi:hypothetical protein